MTTKLIAIVGLFMATTVWLDSRLLSGGRPAVAAGNYPTVTQQELAAHDGSNPDIPVYVVLDGYVYDVSAGRTQFYDPGKPYHFLTGRDASTELHLAGGTIIKQKYPVVGLYRP